MTTKQEWQRFKSGFIVSLLTIGISSGLDSNAVAQAKAEDESLNAKCLLQVDGKKYMNHRCHFDIGKYGDYFTDKRFQSVTEARPCPRGGPGTCMGTKILQPGIFGDLERSPQNENVATLCWNKYGTRSHHCFEGLRRSGACWSNPKTTEKMRGTGMMHDVSPNKFYAVKFCAWAE